MKGNLGMSVHWFVRLSVTTQLGGHRQSRRHGTATKAEVTVQSRDWLGAVIYFGRSHLYPVVNFLESKILKNGLIKIGL